MLRLGERADTPAGPNPWASHAEKRIFRERAIQALGSPEQVDFPLAVVSVGGWAAASIVILTLVLLGIWARSAALPETIPAMGVVARASAAGQSSIGLERWPRS